MERQEMLKWKKAAWQKLMGAIAMLLVASIMMSATSYAWFVLSTAPEVTDLTTTAGANGALEIALQSNRADGTGRADILSGVGQSIASKDAQTANTYWGNVVDLSEGYGLEHITLYPARLNLNGSEVNGETVYSVATNSMLSVPRFGTDGRLVTLDNSKRTNFSTEGNKFVSGGSNWGVNVWGAVNESVGQANKIVLKYDRSIVLREAREKVASYRTELRAEMTDLIERNSLGIMGLMVTTLGVPFLTQEQQYLTVKDYVSSMDTVVTEATDAVQWALLANAAADEEHFSSEDADAMRALGKIYATFGQLPLTGENSVQSIATANGYTDVAAAAAVIAVSRARVNMAANEIDDENKKIGNAGLMLVTPAETVMHGSKGENGVESVVNALAYDMTNVVPRDTIYTLNLNGEDTNLFSSIATFIGDYSGDMTVWISVNEKGQPTSMVGTEPTDMTGWKKCVYSIKATGGKTYDAWREVSDLDSIQKQGDGTFPADSNVGTLGIVSNQIDGIEAPGEIRVEIIRSDVTAYGYSVDLAFQSSESTNLLLQQTGIVRVGSDASGSDSEAPVTMGGGSTVKFTVPGDMTNEQIRNLVQGIYIVFINTGTGAIYKVAAVDPQSIEISWTSIPATVTATLALYDPDFDEDGVLMLGDKSTGNVITALVADTPAYISAVTYLSGDAVTSSMFSATQGLSLDGAINLQFSSSVNLEAMEYMDYATGQ